MKILRSILIGAFIAFCAAGVFSAGFVVGHNTTFSGLPVVGGLVAANPRQGGTPGELADDFAPFWEAWSLVHQEYVDQPVDDKALAYGAIKGMLAALGDRHTGYSTPAESEILFSDSAGELEGIGAEVSSKGDFVEIISPLPGSPAEKAGILPGDLIVEVDGEDIGGQDLFTVISKVRGPAGSNVHLTITREGEAEPLEFDIVRAKITIPSVESKMLEGGIGYVKINNFGEKTTKELKSQLQALMLQNPQGLVLDLRGNPGGLRDTAVEVISQFIGDGTAMIQRYGDGEQEVFDVEPGGLATDIPLVVLINKGSASASEIVAGAIQDYGRGQIVGKQSYGKGTVQNWQELSNNQGSVRITVARWLTPDGRSIDKIGVAPDIEIELTKEDREALLDPQLDAAVNVLQGEAVGSSK
ncbi:MAG: S41 family peptidase [Chloroflexi bacterium]|nr:S41 family peptidase [Chloroflexota bacterium]